MAGRRSAAFVAIAQCEGDLGRPIAKRDWNEAKQSAVWVVTAGSVVRGIVFALSMALLAGPLTGCSGTTAPSRSSTSLGQGGSAVISSPSSSSKRRRAHSVPSPQQRPASARARSTPTAAARLVSGRADSYVVQAQPSPNSCRARTVGGLVLPDPRCTPGAINPSVTQADVGQTICRAGYSATIRPPESITESEKRTSLAAYGDTGAPGDYEYDHLVSLELGGARNDPRNLWPEPGRSPNPKDAIEDELHRAVCDGEMSLAAAQVAIARDWPSALPSSVPHPGSTSPVPTAQPMPTGAAEAPGATSQGGDAAFCRSHRCIASFSEGHGTIVRCADGEWSHSGGLEGVCNRHGGPRG
jgi:hypothetical protein